jgi:hypothetical protein
MAPLDTKPPVAISAAMPREQEFPYRLSLGVTDEIIAEIDEWRRKRKNIPTRAAAARILLLAALAGQAPTQEDKEYDAS